MTRTSVRAAMTRGPRIEPLEPRLVLSAYFVSTTGNDGGAGTATAPWKTLQHAAGVVAPGDVVTVRAGYYAGFDLTTSGTAAKPIAFKADPGVVINAPNSTTPDGINLEGASYVDISGFAVDGMPRAGIRSVTNDHVTIENNNTDSNGEWGIFTGFSNHLLIQNNVASRSVAQHGIYVSNTCVSPVIRGNVAWGNHDSGIHLNGDVSQGGAGVITGAVIEQNILHDNGGGGGSAINADGVQNSVIENNLLYNNHAGGITLFQQDASGPSSGDQIVNNTVVMASDGRWALHLTNGAVNATVSNNILVNSNASSFRGGLDITTDSLSGLKSDYNVVAPHATTDDGNTVLTLAQWRSATGQDAHSMLAPSVLFVNAAGNDYHLAAGSPAIDAGTSLGAPAVDLAGNPRPQGNGYDIGAYESSSTSRPATAVVVTSMVKVVCANPVKGTGTGNYRQKVTITNTSGAAIQGPISLVLDGLGSGITLVNATGTTSATSPAGSRYIDVGLGSSGTLGASQSVTVSLQFTLSSTQKISYTSRVLAGPGLR